MSGLRHGWKNWEGDAVALGRLSDLLATVDPQKQTYFITLCLAYSTRGFPGSSDDKEYIRLQCRRLLFVMYARFIHVVVCVRTLVLFKAEYYPIVI